MTGRERGEVGRPRAGRDITPLVAWVLLLVVAITAFGRLGAGALATPPLGDPSALATWVGAQDPLTTAFTVLRLVVLALAWYLLGVTTIGVVARLARAARLVALADLLTVAPVRRLLSAALGVGLATAAVTSLPQAAVAPPPPVVAEAAPAVQDERGTVGEPRRDPVLPGGDLPIDGPRHLALGEARAPAGEDPAGSAGPLADPDPARAAGLLADPGSVAVPGAGGQTDAAAPGAPSPSSASPPPPSAPTETPDADAGPGSWRVEAGEHLWSIAEAVLAEARGPEVADADVAAYWRALIEANRDALPDPANPDLIRPGQALELPDP